MQSLPTERWKKTRHGSISGRGFHYQEAVATHFAVRGWARELPIRSLIPEGLEDVSLELADRWVHIQIKSRRQHEGSFPLRDVSRFLVKAWKEHPARHTSHRQDELVLVLERPANGVPETGWDRTISDVLELAEALRPLLIEDASLDDIDQLLRHARLLVIPSPAEQDLRQIAAELDLPSLACAPHYWALNAHLVALADENGEPTRTGNDPARLTPSDAQRLFDDMTALVDIDALVAAVRDGLCEAVDFLTPVDDPRFFEGVDVVPGHVVAGLPIERPALVSELTDGLLRRRTALVVGPSGAGKSALLWMSAYGTRHIVRWYRVKLLRESDVEPLLRLANSQRPSDQFPVGFVVDSIGLSGREAWDRLVEEALQRPGLLLLGAVREEDLALVRSAHSSHKIRPTMDEALAERIYTELRSRGATAWHDWREPFEQSDRLLLEYGYILTAGHRLAETIDGQVQRRLDERRDNELRVLRLVATADAWGASLSANALQGLIGATAEDLQRALSRLIAEHMIREEDGIISGLHELRSRHIVTATHRLPPSSLEETILLVAKILNTQDLQGFVAGVLADRAAGDEAAIDRLVDRLAIDPDPDIFTAALQALRLVSFLRLAEEWVTIMEEERVPVSKAVLTTNLALTGAGDSLSSQLLPSIRVAVVRMISTLDIDLRGRLLARMTDEQLQAVVSRVLNVDQATRLLASLGGVPPDSRLDAGLRPLGTLLIGAPIVATGQLLSAARGVSRGLAVALAEEAGGPAVLLNRIATERPWVRDLGIIEDDDGRLTVCGVIRYVAPSAQPDPHGDVVELCRLGLACVPEAEVAACRAVDATGATAGYGDFHIADKRIERRNLPYTGEIAWNRARMRAVASLLGTKSQTARLTAECDLLEKVAQALANAADAFCLNQPMPGSLGGLLREIAADVDALPPPPSDAGLKEGTLDQGELSVVDPVITLANGLANNMVRRLFDRTERRITLAAFVYDTLLPAAEQLCDSYRWRFSSNPPLLILEAICSDLRDLHMVLCERHAATAHTVQSLARHARRSRQMRPLRACAQLAHQWANTRLKQSITQFEARLQAHGLVAQVLRREQRHPNGLVWPPGELAVLVQVPTIREWFTTSPIVLQECDRVFGNLRPIVTAPVRDGHAVASMGGQVTNQKFFPLPDQIHDWRDDLPVCFLDERAGGAFERCCVALLELTGIIAGALGNEIHDREGEAAEAAIQRWNEGLSALTALQPRDPGQVIEEVLKILLVLKAVIEEEMQALTQGNSVDLATTNVMIAALSGAENHLIDDGTVNGARMVLVEWDIEPEGAMERLTNPPSPST